MTKISSIKNTPMIAIVGETASGKSALSLQLAQRLGGEIISADAMTVYKKFDIGTAKPSNAEQALVPHHLIDIVDASERFTVAQYKLLAQKMIEDIAGRNKLPILVGGSGLYIDSVLYNYNFRSRGGKPYRQRLEEMELDKLLELARDKGLDIGAIDIHNKRRVIRHIETNGQTAKRNSLRRNTLVIGVTLERKVLKRRMEDRVDSMLQRGLEIEVQNLSQQYGWEIEPMRSVGYREWQEYFAGSKSINEVKNTIITHTMQLAKKQRTWFKRNTSINWVNNFDEAVEYTTTFLNK